MKKDRPIFNWLANVGEKILDSSSWVGRLFRLFVMLGSVALFSSVVGQSRELKLTVMVLLILAWIIYTGLFLRRFIKDLKKK